MQLLLERHRFSIFFALVIIVAACCGQQVNNKWTDLKDKKGRFIGTWSTWSTWSECSRTCGGGVSVQTRECRAQPLIHKNQLFKSNLYARNRLRLRHLSSNKTQNRCVGVYMRHQLCNSKQCPGKFPSDFRKEQCSAFNQDKLYKWEPFYESTNPCALNCRAIGYRFYATLAQQVVDGTPCDHNGSTNRICVGGICKTIGCDGLIGSDKAFDHCGVCGGDNSTCRIVSGLFTRPQLSPGYNLITSIPQGACNINITELKPTKNYLALRYAGGDYIINGNWNLNWPGDYSAAGTVFTYQRDDDSSNPVEYITAKGPTSQPLEIMMIYKQLNPGIKYQYTLPLRTARSDVGKPLNDVVDRQLNGMTPLSDTPTQYSTQYGDSKPPRRSKVGRSKSRRHYKWQISEFSECSKTCAGGTQSTVLVCVKESSGVKVADIYCKNIPKPQTRTITCNTTPCPPNWIPTAWSQCSASCGKGVQHRDYTCKQQISPNVQVSVSKSLCPPLVNEVKVQVCQIMTCTTWRVGRWSQCSTTCGKGIRNRQVHCVNRDESNLDHNECTPEDKPNTEEVCDLGSCTITWFTTEWSSHQCADACSSGIQSRKVFCPSLEATNCDLRSKPETTKPCPKHDELKCPGKWFVGPWSPCSVSCGKGVESRDIICMMYVRGQYRPVLDFQCAESEKPSGQQICLKQECGSEWYFTEWASCSASCASGSQTREIRCLSEVQKPSTNCLHESRPNTHQGCNQHDCHNDTSQKDSGCLDKFRNCHLVAQSRLCSYNYYRDACCQSCSRFTH